jgi:subtilisin family serine protease
MGFPDRSARGRARLAIEQLEDRTTPTKLDATLALPELVATGAVAGDRVNVVMAAGATSAADAAALAAAPFAQNVRALGFGIYSVTLAPGFDVGTALAFYGGTAGVQSAAPDAIVQLQKTPNDTSYSSLYGMTKIGAPTAWDTTTGSNFVVAVIDTGVDYNHPDLAANMWTNPNETAGDGIDNDGNGFVDDVYGWDFANDDNNPMDDDGHGTHVAGTIGAVGNNSRGVAGVNWSVKIMALKFLGTNGGYTSDAIASLNYAVAAGVKLSNNSWGGGGYDSTLASAIGRARTAGHIFVAAAGNDGTNIDTTASYPASYIKSYDNVVTVAATNSSDALASFSNYGSGTVTLAAPGVSILSTTPNNSYSTYSGTSMAAPHVTGAIALYWGANSSASYSDVISKLKSSVDTVSGLSGKVATGGRLNVGKMFSTSPPPSVAPGPKVSAASFTTANSQLTKATFTFDKAISASTFTSADIVSFTGPGGAITTNYTITPVGTTGTTFDVSFTAQTAAGTYTMVIGPDIRDTSGNQMNQNGNATAGETTADRYTATGSLVVTVNKTFSVSNLGLAIRDNSTTTSTIAVTDDIKLTDLNVKVTLTHTYVGDLVIKLTSPSGKVVTLFSRHGGSGDNLSGTTFDDEAGTAIANGRAPYSGSFRPFASLTGFDGLSTKGTWTLTVQDAASRDTGTLSAWSLTATGTVGGGSGSARVRALGSADEAAFDAPALFAEPIAVTPFAPAGSGAPAADAPASAYLLGESRREYDAPDLPLAPRAERVAVVDTDTDFDAPLAAAFACLYMPPSTESEGDGEGEAAPE